MRFQLFLSSESILSVSLSIKHSCQGSGFSLSIDTYPWQHCFSCIPGSPLKTRGTESLSQGNNKNIIIQQVSARISLYFLDSHLSCEFGKNEPMQFQMHDNVHIIYFELKNVKVWPSLLFQILQSRAQGDCKSMPIPIFPLTVTILELTTLLLRETISCSQRFKSQTCYQEVIKQVEPLL